MVYKVAITETRRKVVAVEANTPHGAKDRVSDAWRNGEVVLGDESFEGIEVFVLGETENTDGKLIVDEKG